MSGSPKSIDVQIGERLYAARQAAALPIDVVAKQVGLPVRRLISFELGESRADARTLADLASVLGIEIREIFAQCCSMQYQSAGQFISTAKCNPAMVELLNTAKAHNFERRVA